MICEIGVFYYCNLVSLYILDFEVFKYIDYDFDVKVFVDGEKRLLDVDEYEQYKVQMNYFIDIDYILKENVKILVEWINENKGFFLLLYINIWYKWYFELKKC